MCTVSHRLACAYARHYLGMRRLGCPLVIVSGHEPPRRLGKAFHFVTPGGAPVTYPRAYRRAFGRPVYVRSTLRVKVGAGWLIARHLLGMVPETPEFIVNDAFAETNLLAS